MSSLKYKYTAMAEPAPAESKADEAKAVFEREVDSLVVLEDKLLKYEYGAAEPVHRPSNYSERLLIATACCCCLGMRAIKYSREVTSKLRTGDIEEARKTSDKVLYYYNASVITGIFMLGFIAIFFIAVFLILIFIGMDAARGLHP